MKRRKFLAMISAVAGISAGCTATGYPEQSAITVDESATTQKNSQSRETSTNDDTMVFEPKTMCERIVIGDPPTDDDGVRPHYVKIWNDSASSREIEVTIRQQEESTTVLHEQYEIPADAALPIILRNPTEYTISLRIIGTDTETTIRSDENWFDCNSTSTDVQITDGGRIDSTFVTTWAECGSTVTGGPDS